MAKKKKPERTTARLNRNQRRKVKRIAEEKGQGSAKRAKKSMVKRNENRLARQTPETPDVQPDTLGQEEENITSGPYNSGQPVFADDVFNGTVDGTDYVGKYEDWLHSTFKPEFDKYRIDANAGEGFQFKTVDDFAQGYKDRGSEFYDNRVRRETSDLDKALAARGIFNSGAALEQNRELISTIRGEETERAYDLASRDANSYNQTILSNQQQAVTNAQNNASRMKELIENELRRNDGLDQASIDNMLRATDMFFANSPLAQGYGASNTIGQNTINFGNQQAAGTAQNYTRVTPSLQAAPAAYTPAPTLDTTASTVALAEARAAEQIAKANNNANQAGNNALTGGNFGNIVKGVGQVADVISQIGDLF